MTILSRSCVAALAAVPFLVASAQAQVIIRAPFTQVEVGPGQVRVQAPLTQVEVAPGQVRVQAPLVRVQPPLVPQPLYPPPPPPAVVVPAVARPLTGPEFAATFKPVPGSYEAVLLHPFTLQPVKVCFTLPATAGCYRVRARPRFIEFESPDRVVEIRFLRNGQVAVEKD
jgi:hypothetical protein